MTRLFASSFTPLQFSPRCTLQRDRRAKGKLSRDVTDVHVLRHLSLSRHRFFSVLLFHSSCTRQIYEPHECTYFTGHNSEKKNALLTSCTSVSQRWQKMDYIALKFRSRVYIHFVSRVSLGLNVVSIDSFPILSLAVLHRAIVFWFVNCLSSTCNQSAILKKHNLWSAIIFLQKEKLFNIGKNYKIIL